MMDKIKEQIDKNKNDKESYQEYIDAFTSTEQIKEIYADDNDFNSLVKEESTDNKKEEDEFF